MAKQSQRHKTFTYKRKDEWERDGQILLVLDGEDWIVDRVTEPFYPKATD